MGFGMDRMQIVVEYYKYDPDGPVSPYWIGFAEHIAKITRQETLAEFKTALDKMQDNKK
jgi:hypothetical protein